MAKTISSHSKPKLTNEDIKNALTAFERDSDWFDAHKTDLKKGYYGEFVAVEDKKVVGHNKDPERLLRELRKVGKNTAGLFIDFVGREVDFILLQR